MSSSSVSMAGGRGCGGRRGQVSNEEAPHRDRNVQDVMIEDLQRQVAELAQHLAAQEVGNREMENSDFDSTFDNLYHNPAPYWEQRGRDEEFVNEDFQEDEFVDEEFIHGDVHDDVEHEDVEDPS
jgi:tryptophan 2,3-dioxygenase